MKEGGRGLGDAVLSVLNLEKEAIELWNADRLHTGKGEGEGFFPLGLPEGSYC